MGGVTVAEEKVKARFVVNCAGGASDKIANMIGDTSFKIKPRLGDCERAKRASEPFGRRSYSFSMKCATNKII